MPRLLALALSFLLVASPTAFAADAPADIKGATTVNADQVIGLIQKTDNLVILDNRNVADFEAGHIEGAVRILDTEIADEGTLTKHVKTKDTPVLFYCNGMKCGRAAAAANKAIGWGYSKVHYYALGMTEWKQRGLPLTR